MIINNNNIVSFNIVKIEYAIIRTTIIYLPVWLRVDNRDKILYLYVHYIWVHNF